VRSYSEQEGLIVTSSGIGSIPSVGRTLTALGFAAQESGRDGMLEDQLFMIAVRQDDGIFVITADSPRHTYSVQQIHRHMPPGLQSRTEK
jgi:hypothetical protein